MPLRSSRRTYNRVVATDDITSNNNGDDVNHISNALEEPLSPSTSCDEIDTSRGNGDALSSKLDDVGDSLQSSNNNTIPPPPIYNEINIILMDAAQTKFNIKCDAKWKVHEFKQVSASITKVPPQSQRLIHMGKLLQDESTLDECGIREDDKIVHLFPKPNVVINPSNTVADETTNTNEETTTTEAGGAHIPQIILDEDEANRRSQILILSSQEIFEAQHRVKIFSFLLMIISSMELLTLMTLFIGVQTDPGGSSGSGYGTELPPGDPTDTPASDDSSSTMQMRTWQNSDYFDTIISAFGFYVSLLGIKATTENTLSLAKRYFICLIIAGIGSNCYYYYLNIQATTKQAQDRNQHVDPTELYTTALVGIFLPITVWTLCIIRAYQFQMLIREAEVEAEERTRGLANSGEEEVGSRNDSNRNNNIDGEVVMGDTPRVLQYGSDDLELAVERGIST